MILNLSIVSDMWHLGHNPLLSLNGNCVCILQVIAIGVIGTSNYELFAACLFMLSSTLFKVPAYSARTRFQNSWPKKSHWSSISVHFELNMAVQRKINFMWLEMVTSSVNFSNYTVSLKYKTVKEYPKFWLTELQDGAFKLWRLWFRIFFYYCIKLRQWLVRTSDSIAKKINQWLQWCAVDS